MAARGTLAISFDAPELSIDFMSFRYQLGLEGQLLVHLSRTVNSSLGVGVG